MVLPFLVRFSQARHPTTPPPPAVRCALTAPWEAPRRRPAASSRRWSPGAAPDRATPRGGRGRGTEASRSGGTTTPETFIDFTAPNGMRGPGTTCGARAPRVPGPLRRRLLGPGRHLDELAREEGDLARLAVAA
ncbi:hypothetical protein QJS66_05880 [Kocuria rhizophila]|nr:hypothetical protein QJS66_05880 [Kocuria rhizophila]